MNSAEIKQKCISSSADPSAGKTRPFLTLSIFLSPSLAAKDWDDLAKASKGSGYQRREFLTAWYDYLAPSLQALPMIVVAYDAKKQPVALLPLALYRRGSLRVAMYAGDRHSNLNMPLLREGERWCASDARAFLQAATKAAEIKPDLFVLRSQPLQWRGVKNPFAALKSAPSPSNAYGAKMSEGADAFLSAKESKATRKKLRAKRHRLEDYGALTLEHATTPERARSILTVFIEQKTATFTHKKKDAGFSGIAVRQFLDAIATSCPNGQPILDLYALKIDDKMIATFGGLKHGSHWHGFVNSYHSLSEFSRHSPGDIILRDIIRDLERRGVSAFDLGVGEARYKAALCTETIALVDVIESVTWLGRLFSPLEILRQRAKSRIKKTPWALAFVERMRAGPA